MEGDRIVEMEREMPEGRRDRRESGEEELQGSTLTMEKVAAAKKFIENHFRTQEKSIEERKERYVCNL